MLQRLVENAEGPSAYVWLWDMYSAEPRIVINGALFNKGDRFMYLFDVDADRSVSVAWRTRGMTANGPSNGFKEGRSVFREGEPINISPPWIDSAPIGPDGLAESPEASSFLLASPAPAESLFDAVKGRWEGVVPAVSILAGGNYNYSMVYLNGTFSYTEAFTFIRIDRSIMDRVGNAVADGISSAAAALAGQPELAAACRFLINIGSYWIPRSILEPDGSLVIHLAGHFCGTRSFGFDPTARPIPGVDQNSWVNMVAGIRSVAM